MFKKIIFASLFCPFLLAEHFVIGATPTPNAEVLEFAKDIFKEKGHSLEIKEFGDYILPNYALNEGELDANLYQHKPFLDDFNANKKTNLISIGSYILVPMAIYSNSIKDIKNVKTGARVAIPNDPTNESRALDLLAKAGLIEFNTKNTLKTPLDISKNPKKLKFIELKAAQLPRALGDVDLAVITTNYALGAGLNPLKDGIFIEDKDTHYSIVLAVRKADENSAKSKLLYELLKDERIKEFINQKYQGSVIPTF